MRVQGRFVVVLGALLSALTAMGAEPLVDETVRDPTRLVIEGLESFTPGQITQALAVDFKLALAGHPKLPFSQYLNAVETTIRDGYLHSGFPGPKVSARFDEETGSVVVQIEEGARCRCGDVSVVGVDQVPAEALIRALTEETPPPDAIPVTVEHLGRPSETVWESAPHTEVMAIPALWKKGAWAPFDDLTIKELKRRLEAACAVHGYFSPQFQIKPTVSPADLSVSLTITVITEGPRATIGNVVVLGTSRDSTDDVLKYLHLSPGAPYDSRLPATLARRLWESGRYLNSRIQCGDDLRTAGTGRANLRIDVRECETAPPLTRDLSEAENSLLKMRDWLERWGRGDTEEALEMALEFDGKSLAAMGSVVGGSAAEPPTPVPSKQLSLRLIVAPRRGQIIHVTLTQGDGTRLVDAALVSQVGRVVLASFHRGVQLELENAGLQQLVLQAIFDTNQGPRRGVDDTSYNLAFGLGFHNREVADDIPLMVRARMSPACALSLIHQETTEVALQEGAWHIRGAKCQVQIDSATGRLIEFKYGSSAEGFSATVRSGKQALQAGLESLESRLAAAKTAYDPSSGWRAISELALDEWKHAADASRESEMLETIQAVRQLVRHWTPVPFGKLFNPLNSSGDEPEGTYSLPGPRSEVSFNEIMNSDPAAIQPMAGRILAVYRQIVPKEAWLRPLGRDAALYFASRNPVLGQKLAETLQSPTIGPTGFLLLGHVIQRFQPTMAQGCGYFGLHRLTAESFRNDYGPLLAGDSYLSQTLLAFVEALRSLEEPEVRAIARLIPNATLGAAVADELLALKRTTNQPLQQALAATLDRLWAAALHDTVKTALQNLAEPPETQVRQPIRDNQVRPAGATDAVKKPL